MQIPLKLILKTTHNRFIVEGVIYNYNWHAPSEMYIGTEPLTMGVARGGHGRVFALLSLNFVLPLKPSTYLNPWYKNQSTPYESDTCHHLLNTKTIAARTGHYTR